MSLYKAIYADVDAVHDLNDMMLSRVIRGCIEHSGRVPDGADREALLRECPEILEAVERAYQQHAQGADKKA